MSSADSVPAAALTPERRRELTRAHLLEAAAAVFAERGFERASLDEIAQRAGFTKGAIYSNFASKAELFLTLVHERQHAMIEEFFAAASDETEPDRNLATRLPDVYARMAPSPAEWALWEEFSLYELRNPEVRNNSRLRFDGELDALVAALDEQWRALGTEPPLALLDIARLYVALFDGLNRQRAFEPTIETEALFGRLVDFIELALHQVVLPSADPSR